MARSYSVYDVFTNRKLTGNPLAVSATLPVKPPEKAPIAVVPAA